MDEKQARKKAEEIARGIVVRSLELGPIGRGKFLLQEITAALLDAQRFVVFPSEEQHRQFIFEHFKKYGTYPNLKENRDWLRANTRSVSMGVLREVEEALERIECGADAHDSAWKQRNDDRVIARQALQKLRDELQKGETK